MEGSVNKSSDETNSTEKAEDDGGNGMPVLDDDRRKLADEFNVQRAKMKELFLQKEVEIRSMTEQREQLQSEVLGLRAELQQLQTLAENQKSEIESLQLLIHETVEASSTGSEEVRRLTARNLELEQFIVAAREKEKTSTLQEAGLAPGALVRSLARKLGADTDSEGAVKKVHRYAQEDAELLRSLVEPLEEEIRVLKEKLRDTDTQLQAATQSRRGRGDGKEGDVQCDMCLNYEKQLVGEQARCEDSKAKARNAERALKIATEELEGARTTHEETVIAWRSERAASAEQLAALTAAAAACRRAVDESSRRAESAARDTLHEVTRLTVEREMLQEKLNTLQKDNDRLIGKYIKKAQELQNEQIDLPNTVEELQEACLRSREELIMSLVRGEEAAGAAAALRAALQQRAEDAQVVLATHTALCLQYEKTRQELDQLQTEREQMKDLGDKLRQSNDRIEELLNDKKRSQNETLELRGRISSLQLELDNSEKVQQDFVRLSQSLQVQLERIREADTEVRWQLEDDVTECGECRAALSHHRLKIHCRHCGRIFCASCVNHSVPSGPRRLPVKVCSMCSTLLQPHTAPYFSTQPPHTPD